MEEENVPDYNDIYNDHEKVALYKERNVRTMYIYDVCMYICICEHVRMIYVYIYKCIYMNRCIFKYIDTYLYISLHIFIQFVEEKYNVEEAVQIKMQHTLEVCECD
jgi:hypothetical protein